MKMHKKVEILSYMCSFLSLAEIVIILVMARQVRFSSFAIFLSIIAATIRILPIQADKEVFGTEFQRSTLLDYPILSRNGRFLKLWDYVKRDREEVRCRVGTDDGFCQSFISCRGNKGRKLGAGNCTYGVCCQYSLNCPSQIQEPCVIWKSGGVIRREAPISYIRTYMFPKFKNACQVRLDFDAFSLDQPTIGTCNTERLSIRGSSTLASGLEICGENANQHMYLTFGSASSINLTFKIERPESTYSIRTTYIKCKSDLLVPEHCLQHFNGLEGRVLSFNNNIQQLNNQYYTVCVEKLEGINSIEWRPCNITSFFVSGNYVGLPEMYPKNCTVDYILIFDYNRICGSAFPAPSITVNASPFLMRVHFDPVELPALTISPLPPSGNPCDPGGPMPCDPADPKPFCCDIHPGFGCTCQVNPTLLPAGPIFDTFNTGFCLEFIQRS